MLKVGPKDLHGKRVIVFGTGQYAEQLYAALLHSGQAIYCFVDNNQEKWLTTVHDIPIKSPAILRDEQLNEVYVLIASSFYYEISNQLQEMGLIENVNYSSAKYWIQENRVILEPFEPGHFYSPIPDIEDVRSKQTEYIGVSAGAIRDISMNSENQLKLFEEMIKYMHEFPYLKHSIHMLRYNQNNSFFNIQDAYCLYGMIRHFKPKAVIEIGSGYSSAVMLDTNRIFMNNDIKLTFIEPYPDRLYSVMCPDDNAKVLANKVQEIELKLFEQLEAGDILFVDSSHVSKAGSDLNWILFEILPRLNKGVIIHFHDIFYPFEYPLNWTLMGRFWNEAYILRAFLQNNLMYQIMHWNHYLELRYKELIHSKLPEQLRRSGSSIWIRKEL